MLFASSPQHFQGALAYSRVFYFLVRCLDPVPRVVVNDIFGLNLDIGLGHNWIRTLYWEYMLAMFLFWWWLGWKIDLKIASRASGPARTLVEFVLGLTLAFMLFFEFRVEHGWASMVWSVGLLSYSLLQLGRGVALLRSSHAVT